MMGYPYPLIQANERRAMTTEEKIKIVLNNANDFDIETIKLMAKGIVPLKIHNLIPINTDINLIIKVAKQFGGVWNDNNQKDT